MAFRACVVLTLLVFIGVCWSEEQSASCSGEACAYSGKCSVDSEDRYDCGYPGIGEQNCLDRGCCFNSSLSGVIWCFHPEITPCDVAEESRYDCGYPGISIDDCLGRGCCHDDSHGTVLIPHCYRKSTSPYYQMQTRSDGANELWVWTHRKTFSFLVTACDSAVVYLAPSETQAKDDFYQITIGDDSNSKIKISKHANGQQLAEHSESVANPLKCDESRSFWISWYDSKFDVGTSIDNILLHWEDTNEPVVINAVGVFTRGVDATWTFSRDMGTGSNLVTPRYNPLSYDDFTMELNPGQTEMAFSVVIPDSAYILLAESGDGLKDWAYEIIIGDNRNTETTIRRYNSEQFITLPTADILGSGQWRHFWLSWKDGHIQLGHGHKVGLHMIIDFIDQNYFNTVRFLSATAVGAIQTTARWFFDAPQVEQYRVVTPDTHHPNVTAHMNTDKTHFLFEVRACADAHILFATREPYYHYEVELGRQENTLSVIRVYQMGSDNPVDHVEIATPDILNCLETRPFWISWEDKQIAVGQGLVLYKHQFMKSFDFNLQDAITGIGLRSGGGYFGEWIFKKDEVTKVVMDLPNSFGYERLWYTMVDAQSVQFRAKACMDVHVILSMTEAASTAQAYEIVIGGDSNKRSEIRNGQGGQVIGSYAGTVLYCDAWDHFWASWTNDTISVGGGTVVGQSVLMTGDRGDDSFPINAVGVSASEKNTNQAQFEFDHLIYKGQIYRIFTQRGDDDKRTRLVTTKDYVYFNVKGKSEAHVVIAADPDHLSETSYTVAIGEDNNQRVSIYRGSVRQASKTAGDVLSSQESRTFYISWSSDTVILGSSSDIGENVLIEYTDLLKFQNLQFVFLISKDDDGAEWTLRQDAGVQLMFKTTALYNYNSVWMTHYDKTSFVFKVKAGNDAHISLSSVESTPGIHPGYEVVLGASANTRSVIRDERLQNDLVSVTTQDILSASEMRYFWISWSSGKIEVGRGNVVGQDSIMNWLDQDNATPVTKTAVSTGWGSEGEWVFTPYEDDYSLIKTTGEQFYDYSNLRIIPPTMNQGEFKFEVMACQDATVSLFEDIISSENQQPSYEIVIGSNLNTKTYIRRKGQTSWPEDQEKDSPNILNCREYVGLAIEWGPGGFIVKEIDGTFLLSWLDPDPLPVLHISLTSSVEGATYKVTRVSGQTIEMKLDSTMPTQKSNRADDGFNLYEVYWGSVQGKSFMTFSLQAKQEAYLLLAEYMHVKTYMAYEIRFGESATWLKIYHPDGSLCAEVEEPELLNENNYKPFWTSWENGRIRVGYGLVRGQSTLITCQSKSESPSSLAVSAFSVDTLGSVASWMFSDARGEVFRFWTPKQDSSGWSFERCLVAPRQEFITFEAQATDWLVIVLLKTKVELDRYEVHLGVPEGTRQKSYIRSSMDGSKYDEQDTPDILGHGGISSFWISWYDNMLTVGHGSSKDAGPVLLKLPHAMTHSVNGLSFASPSSDAYWQIPQTYVRRFAYNTPSNSLDSSRFDVTMREEQGAVFQVQASFDAEVSLWPMVGAYDSEYYVIVIGSHHNSKIELRHSVADKITTVVSKDKQSLLDPNHIRTFWVTWVNGIIRCGSGPDFYQLELLNYQDPHGIVFNGLTMATPQTDGEGHWKLGELHGNTYSRLTADVFDYHTFWMKTTKTQFVFNVRCCNDAHVLMTSTLHQNDTQHAYEVVFGGGQNQRAFIRKGSSWTGAPGYEESAEFPGLVSCDELRTFWTSWGDGLLQAGSGAVPLSHTLLVWQDPEPLHVQYLAVSTGWGSTGEWDISHDQSDDLYLFTRGDSSHAYTDLSVNTDGFNSIVFDVKACSGVGLSLGRIPLNDDIGTFELVLGTNGNRGLAIKNSPDGNDGITGADDVELLDCNSMNTFYVRWSEIFIKIGQGSDISSNELVHYEPEYEYYINSVSFKTSSGIAGEFIVKSTGYIPYPEEENGSGLSLGSIMGIVIGSIITALLVLIIVVLLIPKYQVRLWEHYARSESTRSGNRVEIPMEMHIDPLDIERQVMEGTSGGATTAQPQSGPRNIDPTST